MGSGGKRTRRARPGFSEQRLRDNLDPEVVAILRRLEPVLLPYYELASVLDDVFTEPDALSVEKRKMTTGRVYRAWKDWRKALDPTFNSKQHLASLVATAQTSSMEKTIFGTKRSEKKESATPKRSAKDAQRSSRASKRRS